MSRNMYVENALKMLEASPLKLTSQRVNLLNVLFKNGNKHFSVEEVYSLVNQEGLKISLATVYNCLNQFTAKGILKMVKTSCDKVYFDTNLTAHHHFFCKTTGKLTDINSKNIKISKLPKIPEGKKLNSVEVVVNISD